MSGKAQRPPKTFEHKTSARLTLKPATDPAPVAPPADEAEVEPPVPGRRSQKELILRVVEALKDL